MRRDNVRAIRADVACVAALAVLMVAFWGTCIFGDKVPAAGVYQQHFAPYNSGEVPELTRQWDSLLWDGVAQFYPWRELMRRSLQENGEFPLWNPHQFCGTPFVGNGQSGLFYPPHWILRWFDTGTGMGLLNALHYFLAALFTFLLIRTLGGGHAASMIGAVSYAFGGFIVTWTELPSLIETAAWIPAGLLGVELIFRRRPVIGGTALAVALGASLLAGHFQIAAYVWMTAGAAGFVHAVWWFVERRRPEATEDTTRRGMSPIIVLVGAVVLGGMLGAVQVLPTLELGSMSPRGAGEVTAIGYQFHKSRALLPIELMTIFDPDFIGSPVSMDYPPQRISYSEHCAYTGPIAFGLAVLALIVGWRRKIVWLYAGIAILALWTATGGAPSYIYYFYVPKVGLAGGFSRLLSVFTLCVAVLAGLGAQAIMRPSKAKGNERPGVSVSSVLWVLVAIVLVLALPWAYRFNPRIDAADFYSETELTREIAEIAQGSRVLEITEPQRWTLYDLPQAMLPPNSATVYGYESINGYDSLFTSTYREYANSVQAGIASPPANGNMVTISRPFSAQGAACEYYVSSWPLVEAQDDEKRFEVVYGGPGGYIYRDRAAMPYAGIVTGENVDAAIARRHGPNRVSIELPGADGGTLRVAEGYYPGWVVQVGGSTRKPELCDGAFMHVNVPANAGDVEMVYYPASVVAGGFVTLGGVMILSLLLSASVVRRRCRED